MLLCSGVLMLEGVGVAAPASAHATLLFTSPPAGTAVPVSPTVLTLDFDEAVTLPADPLTLTTSPARRAVQLGPAGLSHGGATLAADMNHPLADGVYTVSWQVIARDGDIVSGSYQFAVGSLPATGLSGGNADSQTDAGLAATLARWAQFFALASLLGEATLRRLLGERDLQAGRESRPWTFPAAVIGLAASLVLTVQMIGARSLAVITRISTSALGSRPGAIGLAETIAFALAVGLAWRWPRRAWLPMIAVVPLESFRAHPGDYAGVWGTLVTLIHVSAAALWSGALIHALRRILSARRDATRARRVALAYARMAVWSFIAVVVSGTLAAVIIVPLHTLTTSRYGLTLLLKVSLVVAATGCAIASRRRLWHARLPRGGVLSGEAVLLVAVLGFSAALTTTAPPRTVDTALPAAPAPVGPVVYLGTRAGQLGVAVAASAGQLVIRLFAPGADDREETDTAYRLAATLNAPGQPPETLLLHECGAGCFVARTAWRAGSNQLRLRATAKGWAGGALSAQVPWPAHPEPTALSRLVDTLRHTGQLTAYERVTSDTASGPGATRTINITGPRFLAVEPYANGRATTVNSVAQPDGGTTLLLAYPSEQVYARLDLDPQGRPLRETLTDPNHLITRGFTYPDGNYSPSPGPPPPMFPKAKDC
jgi:copper transport protein